MDSLTNERNLGRNIRMYRRQKGLSQAALARMLDVSQKAVSAYERSYRLPPSSIIPRVAETLDTTPDALYAYGETRRTGLRLTRPVLWKIVEKLELLSEREREEILTVIEGFIRKKKRVRQSRMRRN